MVAESSIDSWFTNRTRADKMMPEDIDGLQAVSKSLHTVGGWGQLSSKSYDPNYFHKLIYEPEMPPGYHLNDLNLVTVRNFSESKIIGWAEILGGYPEPSIIWIAAFFLDPDHQSQGLGKEIIQRLVSQLKSHSHINSIQVGIMVNNWHALRFWHSLGFDRITKLSKNGSTNEEKFIALEMQIYGR